MYLLEFTTPKNAVKENFLAKTEQIRQWKYASTFGGVLKHCSGAIALFVFVFKNSLYSVYSTEKYCPDHYSFTAHELEE